MAMKLRDRIVVTLMLGFSYASCLAQENNSSFRNGYVAVAIGPAIPVGEFGNSEIGNRSAGFAKTGLTFSAINVGYRFKYVELTALLIGSAFFLSQNAADKDAVWIYRGAFIGSVIPRDISKKVQVGAKAMLGYLNTTSPEITVAGTTIPEQSGADLAIIGGINVRYNVFDRWCAIVDVYYLASEPKFDNYQQKIRTVNVAFGVGFRLK